MLEMEPPARHQCLIYDGAPSKHLPALAIAISTKLQRNYRCLYLNSPPMVAGIGSYLAAAGVDVAREVKKGSLILSSDQSHLSGGGFDVNRMMRVLEESLDKALGDGHAGLWATGDMTWEMGRMKDPATLLEYEFRLEKLFHLRPELSGVCQYHAETLPPEMMRQSLLVHPSIFVSQTLSVLNPHYMRPDLFLHEAAPNATLDAAVGRLCQSGTIHLA
jgi:MEDS: MEthanogen/methylotroph, DcmR Sensory domain